MIQLPIPYEWIEALFGQFVAKNFNTISLILLVIGFMIFFATRNRTSRPTEQQDKNWLNNAQERQAKRWDYTDPTQRPRRQQKKQKQENEPNWYTTGWTWNEKTGSWEPPDYLSQESQERWEWNESSRIWVDKSQMNKEANAKKQEEVRQNWNRYQQENTPKPKVHLTEEEKELANKIHVTREKVSFEEWKAAKMAEQAEETTYHYKKNDIVQDK